MTIKEIARLWKEDKAQYVKLSTVSAYSLILEKHIHDIDVYRKTKPVVEGTPKHFDKDKYRNGHEAEYRNVSWA